MSRSDDVRSWPHDPRVPSILTFNGDRVVCIGDPYGDIEVTFRDRSEDGVWSGGDPRTEKVFGTWAEAVVAITDACGDTPVSLTGTNFGEVKL